ncbi:hypothetical protein BGZ80_010150 [Entomortierella chlamydospora]|uniref:Arm-like repeat domain-containing protein n=1 Tax=Entomortierella chlamydospora TaxID=101097 RepID=A0A9P6T0J5_9FUNG|nr:hypothetical protein BGZ80_010150 [Entomortierella chlamydospora]
MAQSTEDTPSPRQRIFDQNTSPPVVKYDLPDVEGQVDSTPQLAYCLSLLDPSLIPKESISDIESEWSQARVNDSDEQNRLRTMASDLIRAFIRDDLKKPDSVAEIVSLAAVLDHDDSRKLLQVLVDDIKQSVLLEVHLLEGLSHLVKNIPSGFMNSDDLVKILELLSIQLEGTHEQSTEHRYQLALTMSNVLDSMVDSQVEGVSREQIHEPLSKYLSGLQQSSEPELAYQAAYAYQALQYISDDDTILKSMMRRTGKVIQGISGVVSAVKAMDLNGFIDGLDHLQDGINGVSGAVSCIVDAGDSVKTAVDSAQDFLESLKEAINLSHKSSWYPALRGLEVLIEEGRLVEFEKLICTASCRYNPAFQWGVCQRLEELSSNSLWNIDTRRGAVSLLRDMYRDDALWKPTLHLKQRILYSLTHLGDSADAAVSSHSRELLQEIKSASSTAEQEIVQTNTGGYPFSFSPALVLPSQTSPLLRRIQNKPDIEPALAQLKRERLKDRDVDIYISPRAKADHNSREYFDLLSNTQEFLGSDKKVFLILGESGAGKSTFNRNLEISLWDQYEKGTGHIPLFIYLPLIEEPEHNLIEKHLRRINFTEEQIREMKLHREFILICDGYDESQQSRNLYTSNQLNQSRGWKVQMVVSCRTEYTGIDYKECFRPVDRNSFPIVSQYQEAIIVPFDEDQIQDYINQFVSSNKSSWEASEYQKALEEIPNLQDLVKNPFLLKLAMEVLPALVGEKKEFSTTRISRIGLYDEFLAQWINRDQIRLREMELSQRDQEVFKRLSDYGFKGQSMRYLKDLSTAIFDNQDGNPLIIYSDYRDQKTWKGEFFGPKAENNILQEAIPLHRNGDQFRFIHKSVLEYGLSLAIFDPNTQEPIPEPTSNQSRRGSTSSVLSFEIQPSTETTTETIKQPLTNSPLMDSVLGRRSFVQNQSVLQFLVDRAKLEPVFKDQLHDLIERSKTDKTFRIAAANAITILVKSGEQFVGSDLREIKIPGADLSYGVFDSAKLSGADLRKTNLWNMWLYGADLSGAQMDGVKFGELPYLQQDGKVLICMFSPDGKTFAVGSMGESVNVYETTTWTKIHELFGHGGDVAALAYSPLGDQIATGGNDTIVRVWDVSTGSCIHTLEGHSDYVKHIKYSPRGDQVASGSNDFTIRIWDISTGKCIHTLEGHIDFVNIVAYSPQGDQIASGSGDNTVRVWDVATGNCIHTLEGHSRYIRQIAYSPQGDRIVSGGGDATLRLWDALTGDQIYERYDHKHKVRTVAYSPQGDQFASAGGDSKGRIWNASTGECLRTLKGHTDCIESIVYSPQGDLVATGGRDGTVQVWDVSTGNVHILEGHTGKVNWVAFSPQGGCIASAADDSTIRLWDVTSGNQVRPPQGHTDVVTGIAYSPKGDLIVSGSDDRVVRLWDALTGRCIHTLTENGWGVLCVAFSPRGDRIASGCMDTCVRVWDVSTGNCLYTLKGHRGFVQCIAFSPQGDKIISGCQFRSVCVWDIDAPAVLHHFQDHDSEVTSVAFSPQGDKVASGSLDKAVRVRDVATGECIHVLEHSEGVSYVVYLPQGDKIASASNNVVQIWDATSGSCINTLEGHEGYIITLVLSPQGDKIATASSDNTIRIWDISTGNCIRTMESQGSIRCIAYSPQGSMIVSGCSDNSVRLWNAEDGKCLATISSFSKSVSHVAWDYNSDDQYFVTGSYDKSVRRWKVTKGEDGYQVSLSWSSSHEVLMVKDTSFLDVHGLSPLNRQLLGQRDANISSKPVSSEQDSHLSTRATKSERYSSKDKNEEKPYTIAIQTVTVFE